MGADRSRRHHVVPNFYQRRFSRDGRVRVIHREGRREYVCNTKDAFVVKDLLSVGDGAEAHDEAEQRFAEQEGLIAGHLATLEPAHLSGGDAQALRALAALLLGRSNRVKAGHEANSPQIAEKVFRASIADPETLAMFRRDTGRDPLPGELESVLRQIGEVFVHSGHGRAELMLEMYNLGLKHLADFEVSVYDASGLSDGLVFGDNPVVHARGDGLLDVDRPGHRIALRDSDLVYFPLDRRTAVCMTSEREPFVRLDQRVVRMLNNAMWRSAYFRIGAYPEENWRRACGIRG